MHSYGDLQVFWSWLRLKCVTFLFAISIHQIQNNPSGNLYASMYGRDSPRYGVALKLRKAFWQGQRVANFLRVFLKTGRGCQVATYVISF